MVSDQERQNLRDSALVDETERRQRDILGRDSRIWGSLEIVGAQFFELAPRRLEPDYLELVSWLVCASFLMLQIGRAHV